MNPLAPLSCPAAPAAPYCVTSSALNVYPRPRSGRRVRLDKHCPRCQRADGGKRQRSQRGFPLGVSKPDRAVACCALQSEGRSGGGSALQAGIGKRGRSGCRGKGYAAAGEGRAVGHNDALHPNIRAYVDQYRRARYHRRCIGHA